MEKSRNCKSIKREEEERGSETIVLHKGWWIKLRHCIVNHLSQRCSESKSMFLFLFFSLSLTPFRDTRSTKRERERLLVVYHVAAWHSLESIVMNEPRHHTGSFCVFFFTHRVRMTIKKILFTARVKSEIFSHHFTLTEGAGGWGWAFEWRDAKSTV